VLLVNILLQYFFAIILVKAESWVADSIVRRGTLDDLHWRPWTPELRIFGRYRIYNRLPVESIGRIHVDTTSMRVNAMSYTTMIEKHCLWSAGLDTCFLVRKKLTLYIDHAAHVPYSECKLLSEIIWRNQSAKTALVLALRFSIKRLQSNTGDDVMRAMRPYSRRCG